MADIASCIFATMVALPLFRARMGMNTWVTGLAAAVLVSADSGKCGSVSIEPLMMPLSMVQVLMLESPATVALLPACALEAQFDFADGTLFTLTRGQRWRFWRRPLARLTT